MTPIALHGKVGLEVRELSFVALVINHWDSTESFFRMEGEASWKRGPWGIVVKEDGVPGRTEFPWSAIKSYQIVPHFAPEESK